MFFWTYTHRNKLHSTWKRSGSFQQTEILRAHSKLFSCISGFSDYQNHSKKTPTFLHYTESFALYIAPLTQDCFNKHLGKQVWSSRHCTWLTLNKPWNYLHSNDSVDEEQHGYQEGDVRQSLETGQVHCLLITSISTHKNTFSVQHSQNVTTC